MDNILMKAEKTLLSFESFMKTFTFDCVKNVKKGN